jgi:transcriptional regulator with XRE-family HTH domain
MRHHFICNGGFMPIGERLRRLRQARKLTVRELGKLANVRPATITQLETGKTLSMNTDTAVRLCRVLGVSADYLLGVWEDWESERLGAVAYAVGS